LGLSLPAPVAPVAPVAPPFDDHAADQELEIATPGRLGPDDLVTLEDLAGRDHPAPGLDPAVPDAAAPVEEPIEEPVEEPVETEVGGAPSVAIPRVGPAAVTADVLAAAAAQRPRPEATAKGEEPLLELRPSALATEIDRIGDQLVVMTDRIELRDRHGGLRRQLALADIEDVTVERRLTSAVLRVRSRTATDMVVKGLRPDLAEEAQAAVLALLPEVPLINSIEEKALMHSILALHRAGVLNDAEVAVKTELVARMAGHGPSGR
jgi:hypothetical protein